MGSNSASDPAEILQLLRDSPTLSIQHNSNGASPVPKKSTAHKTITWTYIIKATAAGVVGNIVCKALLITVLRVYERRGILKSRSERWGYNAISLGVAAMLSVGVVFLLDTLGLILRGHLWESNTDGDFTSEVGTLAGFVCSVHC